MSQQQKIESLASKEQAAATAKTPAARFTAKWEAELSRSEKNKGDLEQVVVGLERDAAEQDKRLATEKEELAGFRELLKQAGVSGRAADRIKLTLQQLKLRRRVLSRPFRPGFSQTPNEYQDRRFMIEDTLFSIRERWKEEVESGLAQLPEAEKAAFKAAMADLLTRYRAALQDEKGLLTQAISLGQQIQITLLAQMDTLKELERFIQSRVFWLRDDKPLGLEVAKPLGSEIRKLSLWLRKFVSEETTTWLAENLRGPVAIFYGLILFIALPVALFYARQRLRRVTRSRIQSTVDRGVDALDRVLLVSGALMSAALLPAYLLILARFIGATDLPLFLRPVLSRVLEFMAYFLFFWFLIGSLLARRGIARLQFDMPPEAAGTLYRSLRIILIGYIAWLLFWQILRVPPFDFIALPRFCYTLFELMAAVAIVWLVISIGLAYGNDVEKVSEILMQITCEDPDVLQDPAPSVIFIQHGGSSLDFNLRVFIPSPAFIMVLRDRLNKRINQEFEKHGIENPFPQRDLHIKASSVAIKDLLPGHGGNETPAPQAPAKVS
ncbi:MAG: mechanosensitive ion channel [Desulfobacterales bacterium]